MRDRETDRTNPDEKSHTTTDTHGDLKKHSQEADKLRRQRAQTMTQQTCEGMTFHLRTTRISL